MVNNILYISSAGNAAWMGPAMFAGVCGQEVCELEGLDKKHPSTASMQRMAEAVQSVASLVETQEVSVVDFNELGFSIAMRNGCRGVLEKIFGSGFSAGSTCGKVEMVLIDGNVNFLHETEFGVPVRVMNTLTTDDVRNQAEVDMVRAGLKAAKMVATVALHKVVREELDAQYPEYGLFKNGGYGTPEHLAAIRRHGLTKEHRLRVKELSRLGLVERGRDGLYKIKS